jgi:hypothetical protein
MIRGEDWVSTRWSHAPFVTGQSDGTRTQQTKSSSTWMRQPSVPAQIAHGLLGDTAVHSVSAGARLMRIIEITPFAGAISVRGAMSLERSTCFD